MKRSYTKLNLEKSKEFVNREAERTIRFTKTTYSKKH
ncbi:MAG TPA: palindromic element RPE5 domain-containing protein [Rickettsia endosymbiont of Pyrocoelia pectoralis]|nr:palindromic element RPE5 domain-containing protein [Rickettsia endosymbiont of Pyrocoelia pectoralis]